MLLEQCLLKQRLAYGICWRPSVLLICCVRHGRAAGYRVVRITLTTLQIFAHFFLLLMAWHGMAVQAKRLTQEDFAMNHPAGRIGKRLILRVRDVMLTGSSLPLIGPDVLIMEV